MCVFVPMYVCVCVCIYKISEARNDMVACREVVSTLDYVRCIGYWSIESKSVPDFYGNSEVKFDLMICVACQHLNSLEIILCTIIICKLKNIISQFYARIAYT